MIHYDLRCATGHSFDGWFRDSSGFDAQVAGGLVECPACGSTAISKQLMAPAIARKGRVQPDETVPSAADLPAKAPANMPVSVPTGEPQAAAGPAPAQFVALLQRMRSRLEKTCDYVGSDFASAARKLHRRSEAGEAAPPRGIYGEASDSEAEALRDEGIEVARIPWVPPADA